MFAWVLCLRSCLTRLHNSPVHILACVFRRETESEHKGSGTSVKIKSGTREKR